MKDSLDCTAGDHIDLLQLERTFRPLRSIADAHVENRVVDDICILQNRSETDHSLDEIKAFSAAETMEVFGGEDFLRHSCDSCIANVHTNQAAETLNKDSSLCARQFAGCYGYLQSTYDGWNLFQWWQEQLATDSANLEREPGTKLDEIWRHKNQEGVRYLPDRDAQLLLDLIQTIPKSQTTQTDWLSLKSALQYSLANETLLQIHVVPEAQIVDRNWIVPQHCSECIFPITKWNGNCPNCKTTMPPNSKRKRQLRGDRPYWQLTRFVGEEKAQALADRYFDQQLKNVGPGNT